MDIFMDMMTWWKWNNIWQTKCDEKKKWKYDIMNDTAHFFYNDIIKWWKLKWITFKWWYYEWKMTFKNE